MFRWSQVQHCYKIFSNNSIFFHLMTVPITELHVKAACNSRAGVYLDLAAGMSQDHSMGFGLMANTFCYYLLNIEHVPLIRRTFQKSNRKTEPNVPKCFCAGIANAVLKSSPQLPLQSPCAKPRARGASPGLHGDAWSSSQVWQCTGKVITTGLLSCSCMRRQPPRIQLLKEPDIKLEMRQSCKGWLKLIKKCLFPPWPLPSCCFSAALCWFALLTINAPSRSSVWFPLDWGVEVQRDTERGSEMSPFGQQINLVLAGLALCWSSATGVRLYQHWAIGSVFVPPVPSEDQACPPNAAFLELKQQQHTWHKWGQWWHKWGQLQIHFNRGSSGGCSGGGLMKANVNCDQDAWSWLVLSLESKGLVSSVLWGFFCLV